MRNSTSTYSYCLVLIIVLASSIAGASPILKAVSSDLRKDAVESEVKAISPVLPVTEIAKTDVQPTQVQTENVGKTEKLNLATNTDNLAKVGITPTQREEVIERKSEIVPVPNALSPHSSNEEKSIISGPSGKSEATKGLDHSEKLVGQLVTQKHDLSMPVPPVQEKLENSLKTTTALKSDLGLQETNSDAAPVPNSDDAKETPLLKSDVQEQKLVEPDVLKEKPLAKSESQQIPLITLTDVLKEVPSNAVKDTPLVKSDILKETQLVTPVVKEVPSVKTDLVKEAPLVKPVVEDLQMVKSDLMKEKPLVKPVEQDSQMVKSDLVKEKPLVKPVEQDSQMVKSDLVKEKPLVKPVEQDSQMVKSDLVKEKPLVKPVEQDSQMVKSDLVKEKPLVKPVEQDLQMVKSDLVKEAPLVSFDELKQILSVKSEIAKESPPVHTKSNLEVPSSVSSISPIIPIKLVEILRQEIPSTPEACFPPMVGVEYPPSVPVCTDTPKPPALPPLPESPKLRHHEHKMSTLSEAVQKSNIAKGTSKEMPSLRLLLVDPSRGIYRTENGDNVRLFRVNSIMEEVKNKVVKGNSRSSLPSSPLALNQNVQLIDKLQGPLSPVFPLVPAPVAGIGLVRAAPMRQLYRKRGLSPYVGTLDKPKETSVVSENKAFVPASSSAAGEGEIGELKQSGSKPALARIYPYDNLYAGGYYGNPLAYGYGPYGNPGVYGGGGYYGGGYGGYGAGMYY